MKSSRLFVPFLLFLALGACLENETATPELPVPDSSNPSSQKQLLASYDSLGVIADHVTCEPHGSGCVLQVPADFLGDEENSPEGEEVMAPDESADEAEAASFIEVELVCKWTCEKGDAGLLFSGPPSVIEDAETVKWLAKVKEAAAELKDPVVVGIFPGLESALVLDASDDLKSGMRKATGAGSLGAGGMLVGQTGGRMTSNVMNVSSAVAGTAKGMTGSLGGGMSVGTQAMYVNGLLQERGEKFTASIGGVATGVLGNVVGGTATGSGTAQTAGSSSATTTEPTMVSTGVILYQYDGLNRMVGRSTKEGNKETNTRWDYFGMMKLVEARENRDLGDVEFYHGARGIEAIKTGRTGEKLYALHKDHLGSTAVVTDESNGNVAEWDFYDPYGKLSQKQNSSPTGNPILYTGYYYDPSADIYLAPYRAYDPELGRFMQRDWLGIADGPNEYAYVGNSSLGFVDPLGLSKQDPKEASDPGYWNYLMDEELPGYVAGFSHAYVQSTTGYAMGDPSWWDPAFNRGETVGRLVGAGQGIVETITGIAGVVAGAGMSGGGAVLVPVTGGASALGVPAGAAVIAAGVAGAGHGTWTVKNALEGLVNRPMQRGAKAANPLSDHAEGRMGERNFSDDTIKHIKENGKKFTDADYPGRTTYVLDNKDIPGLESDPGSRMVVVGQDGKTIVTVIHRENVVVRVPTSLDRRRGSIYISEVKSQTQPNRPRYTRIP